MELKEGGNCPLPVDARRELGRCGVGNALFQSELRAYKRMFSEDEKMDESYKILLSCLFTQEKQFVVPQTKKQNGKDNENVKPGLKEGVEMPNKQKGKGLLIHYVDVNIHGVVGKNQNRKDDHVIEHGDDVRENGVKAFELEKKRKGEDLFTEHDDQLLRANSVKSLTEMVEPREKQNEKAPQEERSDGQLLRANSVKPLTERFEPRLQEERSEPPVIIKQNDTDDTKEEDDSGYKLFLKFMDEYKQAKNEATVMNEEGVGSNKDNEPEPERKSTKTLKPNVELPIQVPSPVKRSNVGNLTNDESEKAEIERCSARQSGKSILEEPNDKGEDENMEIGKHLSCRSRKVVFKEPSDGDKREEIEKHPSCEVGKNREGEKVKADIEKCSSRRSRKVNYKEPRSSDEGAEIEKHSSREVRNVLMKKSKNKKAAAEIEKHPSHRSRKVFYKEHSSGKDEDEIEIEKRSSREVRNDVVMNKSKKAEAEIEKPSSRRSREVFYKDYSSNDEREEIEKRSSREIRNVVMKKPKNEKAECEIKKHPSHRPKKAFYIEHSSGKDEDEIEIEKRSSCEVRNDVVMNKSKKAEAEIEKPSSRRSREVFYKDYSSNDEREEIEKRSSREIRNVVMKKPKNEKAECEIKKHPSHLPKKAFYIEHSSGEDEEEREEIEKRSSREVRNNVVMKKSKKAQAEIEKLVSRRSKEVFYQDYSSNDDREEIRKRSSREVRNNVVVKKSKKSEAEIEKLLSRRSRGVPSNENSDVEIKKHASSLAKLFKAILAELSDKEKDVNVSMKKHKNEKVKDEIEKRSTHQSRKVCKAHDDRKVAMKRLRDEDIEEKIERSRYGIEGRTSHNFRVGESSAHPRKTDKDSLEDEDSSDDDSELEILEKHECLNGPFVTGKSYYVDVDGDCNKSSEECMEFRGKVLEVISKPYDKSEYNALYAEFREKCYPAHHPDLVDKLKMNRWRPRKRLAILRGYFFWLQNLTQKGSFKPWNDSVCLDVEPEWPLQTRQTPGNRL